VSEPFDINALLSQAMEMQSQLIEAQAEAAEAEVVGRAGGGAVEITVTGSMQFLDVSISAEAVDPDDVATLEDAVLAALHDAMSQIDALQRTSLGDLDLGALGGLAGMAPGSGGALDVASTAADDPDRDDEPRP
jgi:DNA-binding YbaB/EbfC family protein